MSPVTHVEITDVILILFLLSVLTMSAASALNAAVALLRGKE